MELQLGLSLATAPFDLNAPCNKRGFDQAFPSATTTTIYDHYKTREYDDVVEDYEERDVVRSSPEAITLLPLFVWSSRGRRHGADDHDGDGGREETSLSHNFLRSNVNCGYRNVEADVDDEEHQVSGWPPIRSWKKQLLIETEAEDHNNYYDYDYDEDNLNYGTCGLIMPIINSSNNSSKFVKVKMEGIGIIRKIDLNLYHSYPSLLPSLLLLFATHCQSNNDEKAGNYTVMYKGGAGNWLIAGEVPWQKFLHSVQRIEILRRN